jgi:hypothetical protein
MLSETILKNLLVGVMRLEEGFRTWLERLMLYWAIERAHRKFARRYPRWADSLFDRYFIQVVAGPLLVQSFQAGELPAPAELGQAWVSQLGPVAARWSETAPADVVAAAADFLDGLEAELACYRWLSPEPCGAC